MLYLALPLTLGLSAHPHGRSLSYTNILGYAPGSQVTDHASTQNAAAARVTDGHGSVMHTHPACASES